MALREWSENVVSVENHHFLKKNCEFLSVIRVKWKKSVCFTTLLYSSTFYSLFLAFFVLKIFKFKYDKVFLRHSASISNDFRMILTAVSVKCWHHRDKIESVTSNVPSINDPYFAKIFKCFVVKLKLLRKSSAEWVFASGYE